MPLVILFCLCSLIAGVLGTDCPRLLGGLPWFVLQVCPGYMYNVPPYLIYHEFTVLQLASVLGTDCPDSWVAFHGSCYKFARDATVFTHAEEYCRQHYESHLVHIETSLENQFLKTFLQDFDSTHHPYWIGMTDETVEGMWVWHGTDTRVNFTDWNPNEPQNHGGNEDCAAFMFSSKDGSGLGWSDMTCIAHFKPICELSKESSQNIIG